LRAVAIDGNGIKSGQIAAQGMMPPTGNIHFLGRFRDIRRGKPEAELLGVVRFDYRLGACLEETFQPFVLEALDHATSARCRFTLRKGDRHNEKGRPFRRRPS
jgi:hypothetical protein